MFDLLAAFSKELNKCTTISEHIGYLHGIVDALEEDYDFFVKFMPIYSNAHGYLYSVNIIEANNNKIPELQKSFDKILHLDVLEPFLENCKEIGDLINKYFIEVVKPQFGMDYPVQQLSPTGRRLFREIQSMINRRGLQKLILRSIDIYKKEKSVIENLFDYQKEEKHFYPYSREFKIGAFSSQNPEIVLYLKSHFTIVACYKLGLDLLYNLLLDNVPVYSTEMFDKLIFKKIGNKYLFRAESKSLLIMPRTKYVLVENHHNNITLLVPTFMQMTWVKSDFSLLLKGFYIEHDFEFIDFL